ncbi:uncharacterized protein LOC112961251 [Apteryx rowi]|uniref:uncharacterized protein LOC112961251 n=1 Tax=Apteryx rowi TaxID=308060 RepID=UPI000E1D0047|nr:uncharacterized protein LOC112961251 [Apteryx rowi]
MDGAALAVGLLLCLTTCRGTSRKPWTDGSWLAAWWRLHLPFPPCSGVDAVLRAQGFSSFSSDARLKKSRQAVMVVGCPRPFLFHPNRLGAGDPLGLGASCEPQSQRRRRFASWGRVPARESETSSTRRAPAPPLLTQRWMEEKEMKLNLSLSLPRASCLPPLRLPACFPWRCGACPRMRGAARDAGSMRKFVRLRTVPAPRAAGQRQALGGCRWQSSRLLGRQRHRLCKDPFAGAVLIKINILNNTMQQSCSTETVAF